MNARASRKSDRIAGALLMAMGIGIGIEALSFDVAFITDPVGPKALPLLAALVMLAGGLSLLLRPVEGAPWPAPVRLRRIAIATSITLLYALLLPWLGFVAATSLAVFGLVRLFDGPASKGAAAALLLSALLWLLFAVALGVRLAPGALFE